MRKIFIELYKAWKLGREPFYRLALSMVINYIYKPDYQHLDKIPAHGAAVLVCNHVSYADGAILAVGCPRPIRFVIDADIYNLPIVNYFMRLNRAIPILPTRQSVSAAMDEISAGLQAGDLICIFPEGQLTYTGGISRFKQGVIHMIERNPVPVYPLAMTGLWGSIFSRRYLKSWRRFYPFHKRNPIRVICGDAIAPEGLNVNQLQVEVLRLKHQIQARDKNL